MHQPLKAESRRVFLFRVIYQILEDEVNQCSFRSMENYLNNESSSSEDDSKRGRPALFRALNVGLPDLFGGGVTKCRLGF